LNEFQPFSSSTEHALDLGKTHCLLRPYEFSEHHKALHFSNEFIGFPSSVPDFSGHALTSSF